jgi:hypothetical protein
LAHLRRAYRVSARTAKAGVGLELVDDRYEIIKPDNPFELETGAGIAGPDYIGFDPAHYGQSDNDSVTALQLLGIIDHEAVRRQIADMKVQVAMHEMLDDRREVDRVPCGTPQVSHTKICSASHALRPSLLSGLEPKG